MTGIVRQTIARYDMLHAGETVAVGLSGGADSVSLLHVLLELASELNVSVRAIHINHGIRGAAADSDERFCRELCARLGVALDCFRLDVPVLAAERGVGLEQCGRDCRYERFEAIAAQYGCTIATAHTLSDSVETVLFNLSRGSGLSGVCGIPPVRGCVIRPLIGVTREQVEAYCREHSLAYVTDETNSDTAYSRNLIRHEIVARLRRVNPALHEAIRRFSESARDDDEYLDSLARDALTKSHLAEGWDACALAALPSPLRRRAIILAAQTAGASPQYSQVLLCEECLARCSGAVTLNGLVSFAVANGRMLIRTAGEVHRVAGWSVPAVFPQTVLPDGRVLILEQLSRAEYESALKKHNWVFKNALGYDIMSDNIHARTRREGDRFAPAGRGVTKRLKKLLCDEHIPHDERERLVILEGERGILWLEGFGASELCRPGADDAAVVVPRLAGDGYSLKRES